MFVPIAIVIFEFHSIKTKVRIAFEEAQEEVIFSSDQVELNETKSFETTYPDAHGIFIRNAQKNEGSQSTDLNVEYQNGDSVDFVYTEGEEFLLSTYETPISVRKENEFEGKIEFLNFVCGCENMDHPSSIMDHWRLGPY